MLEFWTHKTSYSLFRFEHLHATSFIICYCDWSFRMLRWRRDSCRIYRRCRLWLRHFGLCLLGSEWHVGHWPLLLSLSFGFSLIFCLLLFKISFWWRTVGDYILPRMEKRWWSRRHEDIIRCSITWPSPPRSHQRTFQSIQIPTTFHVPGRKHKVVCLYLHAGHEFEVWQNDKIVGFGM